VKAKLIFAACALIAGSKASAALSLTTPGIAYTQNFNSLVSTGTSAVLPVGWEIFESGTSSLANGSYTAGTGSIATGDTYSFGAAGSGERALGSLRSGTLIPLFGVGFSNDTGSPIVSLDIAFTGEMWRLGTVATTRPVLDRLDFQYSVDASSINTGTWTDVDALDFSTPDNSGGAGGRDGNVAPYRTSLSSVISGLSIQPGATVWLRWSDFDVANADDGLAVDDFSLTPRGAAVTTPEAGAGFVLTGLVLFGLLLVAKAVRLRSDRSRMVLCPAERCRRR